MLNFSPFIKHKTSSILYSWRSPGRGPLNQKAFVMDFLSIFCQVSKTDSHIWPVLALSSRWHLFFKSRSSKLSSSASLGLSLKVVFTSHEQVGISSLEVEQKIAERAVVVAAVALDGGETLMSFHKKKGIGENLGAE